jgi:hypothetical protein
LLAEAIPELPEEYELLLGREVIEVDGRMSHEAYSLPLTMASQSG